ncbi:MAG: Nif3-like dinuclear metal center hexameric protein [Rikenellaceae bacterium]
MIKVADLVSVIEDFAPKHLAESYDNTGLLVGSRDMVVTGLLTTVDVTEKSIEEAKKIGANMILSHHPLIFKGIKNLNGNDYIERCVIELIKSDIALYCAHTSVDATFGGISYRMGEKLGLQNMSTLSPSTPNNEGYGVVGSLKERIELKEFLAVVKSKFDAGVIRYAGEIEGKSVERVALCGGSGASLIGDAQKSGADIYISADFKYHDFFLTEKEIILADIGHFESEKVVLDIFSDIISKKYPTFAVCKSNSDSNPVLYL